MSSSSSQLRTGSPSSTAPLKQSAAYPSATTAVSRTPILSAPLPGQHSPRVPVSPGNSAAAPPGVVRKRPSFNWPPGGAASPPQPRRGEETRTLSPAARKMTSTGSGSKSPGVPERATLRVPSLKALKEHLHRKTAAKPSSPRSQNRTDNGPSGDESPMQEPDNHGRRLHISPSAPAKVLSPSQVVAPVNLTWKLAPPADVPPPEFPRKQSDIETEEVEVDGVIEEPKCSATPAMEGCLSTKDSNSLVADLDKDLAYARSTLPQPVRFPPHMDVTAPPPPLHGTPPVLRSCRERTNDSTASWGLPSDVEELNTPVHPSAPVGTLRSSTSPPEAPSPPVVDTPRPVSAASSNIPFYGNEMRTTTSTEIVRQQSQHATVMHGTADLIAPQGYLGVGPFWTCGGTPVRNNSRRQSRAGSRQSNRPGVHQIPAPLIGSQEGVLGRIRTAVCQGISVCGHPRSSSPLDLPPGRRPATRDNIAVPLQVEALISSCMGLLANSLDVPGGKEQIPDSELSTISLETKEQRLMWRDFLSEAVSQTCTSNLFSSYDVEASPGNYPRPPPSCRTPGGEPKGQPDNDDEDPVPEPEEGPTVIAPALVQSCSERSLDLPAVVTDGKRQPYVDIQPAGYKTSPPQSLSTTGPVSRQVWQSVVTMPGAPARATASYSDPVRSSGAGQPSRQEGPRSNLLVNRPMMSSQPSLLGPGNTEPPGAGPVLRSPLLVSRSVGAPPGATPSEILQAQYKQRCPAPAPLRSLDGRPKVPPEAAAPAG